MICGVVLAYIFAGGSRAAAWANTPFKLSFSWRWVSSPFLLVSKAFGGLAAAIEQANAQHLVRTPERTGYHHQSGSNGARCGDSSDDFFDLYVYSFVGRDVSLTLFQHWLTAKSAKTFKLTVIAPPHLHHGSMGSLCFAWTLGDRESSTPILPSAWPPPAFKVIGGASDAEVGKVLSVMIKMLIKNPIIVGLVTAGILAAIMSSLDSQFLCLGTIFTNDVVLHNKAGRPLHRQTESPHRPWFCHWHCHRHLYLVAPAEECTECLRPRGVEFLRFWGAHCPGDSVALLERCHQARCLTPASSPWP